MRLAKTTIRAAAAAMFGVAVVSASATATHQAMAETTATHRAQETTASYRASGTTGTYRASEIAATHRAPETPAVVCGPGYKVLRQAGFDGGTAYLLYNAAKRNACAVTFKTRNVGTRSMVWSAVDVKDAGVVKNEEITPLHTVPVYHAVPAGAYVKFSGGTKAADSGGGYERIG
ncbi:hypothetical protein ACIBEJ_05035 [Nonomuraea sp. NPDC050790]|uniref:hypothetical protein n=1 Tax=Nonomuraea sp. NPDC050790 TaxID=3364371 RepID=UPI0037A4F220